MAIDIKSEVYKVLKKYGEQVLNEMKNRLINAGKVASGTLLNSLAFVIESEKNGQLTLSVGATGKADDYLYYVDKGRKPGKMPPIAPIQQWCKVKGIPEEAAWPIAKNIGKFGIKPTNFFTISITRRAKQLDKMLEEAILKDAQIALFNELGETIS